ncbi:MAG TPA: hypothetical protein VET89_14425 [Stellaceae bacterium]|nr:hypothetical protein [Stellaceae bacterium]
MASSLYLTLLVGPVVPLPAPKPVIDALTSITVTTSATGRSGFQLSFTLADRSVLQALFLLAPPGVELRVVVMVTVNGLPQVLMDGVMREHEVQPSAGSAGSTMTITGDDLTAVMDLLPMDGTPYPGMPPEARVALILSRYAMYGVIPEIVPSLIPDVPVPVERFPSHDGTDLAYINRLAGENGYVFYIDPGPVPGVSRAYWGPQVKFGAPQPALTVNMDTWTNVDQLSFHYAPYRATTPIVTILDETTGVPIPIPIPPVTPLNPPLGIVVPTPMRSEFSEDAAKDNPGQALMRGMARASAAADVVTGSGSLDVLRYGQVLQARRLVGVRGAGPAFDGLHYVDSVTHTISRGQYQQSFTLTRNALVSNTPVVPAFGL